MSLLRRRSLIPGVGQLRLPKEFQKVAYIESTGTQSINTGYLVTPNTSIEIVFQLTAKHSDGMLFGTTPYYVGSGSSRNAFFQIYLSTNWDTLNPKYNIVSQIGDAGSEDILIEQDLLGHCIKRTPAGYVVDGVYKELAYSDNINKLTQPVWLFCRTGNNRNSKCRIYRFDIFENDTLVRSYVPCYRKSDNVIGMYELVNDVFYTNAGSGSFIYGLE